jgi:cob(I)alamin adenosyltransferase
MSIVTKKGDLGRTTLISGRAALKSDPRVDTYGTLDELVSFLGLTRAFLRDKALSLKILNIQKSLFFLAAELAGGASFRQAREFTMFFEHEINSIEKRLPRFKKFIIPGKGPSSALFDVSRTVCRRLERKMAALFDKRKFKNREAMKYINRMSDLLWLYARIV